MQLENLYHYKTTHRSSFPILCFFIHISFSNTNISFFSPPFYSFNDWNQQESHYFHHQNIFMKIKKNSTLISIFPRISHIHSFFIPVFWFFMNLMTVLFFILFLLSLWLLSSRMRIKDSALIVILAILLSFIFILVQFLLLSKQEYFLVHSHPPFLFILIDQSRILPSVVWLRFPSPKSES